MRRPTQLSVEVEPLSEARWALVERELFAKLDERPMASAPAGHWAGRRLVLTWAAITVAVAAASFAVVHSGRGIREEDRVRLATTDSYSEFTVGESSLTVAPRSLVMVSGDDDRGIDVLLDRGTVTCQVAPRRGRPSFRLDAGEVRIRVIGTKFTVTREDGETSIDVERGAVEVAARGVVTVLHDGGHWPEPRASGTPALTGGPSPLSSFGTNELAASQARFPARTTRGRHALATEAPAQAMESIAPETTAATEPIVETPAATNFAPSPQQAFEEASRKERTNPGEAEAIYRQLAAGTTGWAPNALFALARLEAERGHRTEASRLLNTYLMRYPHGINADDARELLRRMR